MKSSEATEEPKFRSLARIQPEFGCDRRFFGDGSDDRATIVEAVEGYSRCETEEPAARRNGIVGVDPGVEIAARQRHALGGVGQIGRELVVDAAVTILAQYCLQVLQIHRGDRCIRCRDCRRRYCNRRGRRILKPPSP